MTPKRVLFDVEADGLLHDAQKMHVFSWVDLDDDSEVVHSTFDELEASSVLDNAEYIVGHHIVGYDLPLMKKLFGVKAQGRLCDTLGLSWYLRPDRNSHGLDSYGKDHGIEKVKIYDWDNLSPEEYQERCEQDVRINLEVYKALIGDLRRLYFKDEENAERLIDYLTFKLTCAHKQEALGWHLDVKAAEELRDKLTTLKAEAEDALKSVMPDVPVMKTKEPPKRMYKADGSPTAFLDKWHEFLDERSLPRSTSTAVKYVDGYQEPNPNSPDQLKEWLFSHGWQPDRYKYVGSKYQGTLRAIPQIKWEGELTRSVEKLVDEVPEVKHLSNLSVISHRLATVQGFLDKHKDGWLEAGVQGLTNTFRFKHVKPLVNLPGVDKPWGKEIRGLLNSVDGHILCGADMVSLEDTTKRHYMQPLDPEYVEEMSKPEFDPHLDLAVFAGAVSREDAEAHTNGTKDLSALRKSYKAANYACVYGVKEDTLSRQTGLSKPKAKKLIADYWKRNWSIKKVAEDAQVVERIGYKWVWNPVSRFWMNLRFDKDRWSTINQSTGVYCFDTWLKHCTKQNLWPCAQFHDEGVWPLREQDKEKARQKLLFAIRRANEELNLNVELGIDIQFGNSYAEIH